ncbi:MAG TPA: rhomboid family intramembrane serine protease [Enteractinococcus helveticum]|uniref:Rhomboid family intramembrane serine protease n=1 Tax=Enteractinococcus helveticum TaxID=1837282 RepID=A0A921FM59_9MICC|nr:rhomboid family intramembrane serine protease [Enteractinococcus helveticum]HJF13782.1 rhomboid family intramembrane serine protease [Enteractinococcus helveticum]
MLCVDCVRQHQRSIPREQRAPRFTDRQGNAIPLATYIIIGLTVVVYGLQWVGQLIPGFPDVSNLLMYSPLHTSVAAVEFSQVTGQQLFQPWRMLTSALVHSMGSPLHLLLNMAVLWLIGRQIEQFLGAAKFVAIYVLSAFGGSVAVLFLAEPNSAVVGASGAVYGLFAALWMIGRRLGADTRSITILIIINFAFSFIFSGISWQGHLGGFLTGLAASTPVVLADKKLAAGATPAVRKRTSRLTWLGLALVAVVLVALTFIGALLIDTQALLGS